ncbi:MAG: hypothetical protein HKP53_02685 [Eudoraea sp.]|nr:hypothetical protein [Eudoraea sp.]
MAYLEGAEILEMRLLPGIHKELGFYFGYVKHSGDTSWLTEAAPFFSDLLLLITTSMILAKAKTSKYYDQILLFGIISPIVDLVYNYQGGLWRTGTDVADLLEMLPRIMVHTSFLLVIVASIIILYYYRNIRRNYT